MAKGRIETGKAPLIHVEACDGDLIIQSWSEPALQVRGNYEVGETGDGYRVTGRGDLRLTVPAEAQVNVEEVSGDVVAKSVEGGCVLGQVHGDAILIEVGAISITTVHGNLKLRGVRSMTGGQVHGDVVARRVGGVKLSAVYGDLVGRRLEGPVTIEEASGDVELRTVDGDVAIGTAHRDVNAFNVTGLLMLGNVDGDVRLRGALPAGDHAVVARGDIVVNWPPNVPLNLVAEGSRITNRLSLHEVSEKEGRLTGKIGSGAAQLTLSAGGRIILKEAAESAEKWEMGMEGEEFESAFAGWDPENMAARVEAEVNSHMARVARNLETRFGPEFGQRVAEKVSRHMERTAERVGDRSRRRTDWRGRTAEAATATPQRRTASSEEQLKILKMVESGAITPEDASMLLEALES